MNQDLHYRAYQPGDEKKILELFKLVFGREMSPDYWKWRFKDNPAQLIHVDLAWHKDQLVGQYATSPVTLAISGEDCLTNLSLSTMTHPDYRGKGILENLANRCYERAESNGSVFAWGFPNANIHYTRNKKLKWADIYEVPTMRLALTSGVRLPSGSQSENIVEVREFGREFDVLWDKLRNRCQVMTKRDARYLEWRYLQCPSQRYTVLSHIQNGEVRGYVICKLFENGSERVADVVDLLADNDDDVGCQLVLAAIKWSSGQSCKAVNMWMNVHHPLHGILEKLNFQNTAPVTYLGGRLLKGGSPKTATLYAYNNWYLTMGDSDVY